MFIGFSIGMYCSLLSVWTDPVHIQKRILFDCSLDSFHVFPIHNYIYTNYNCVLVIRINKYSLCFFSSKSKKHIYVGQHKFLWTVSVTEITIWRIDHCYRPQFPTVTHWFIVGVWPPWYCHTWVFFNVWDMFTNLDILYSLIPRLPRHWKYPSVYHNVFCVRWRPQSA